MLLAAEQTVRDRLLELPDRTQPLLKCFGILELGNLLEFVDANDDIATFLLRDFLGKLQNFVDIVALGFISSDIEKSVVGSGPNEILGLIRERNSLAFSSHSSNFEEVCLRTAAANAS